MKIMRPISLKVPLLRALCVFVAVFTLHACGGSDPVSIAEQFAKAYCDADFDKCNKLMFEDAENRFVPSSERNDAEKEIFRMMQAQAKEMNYKLKLNSEQTEIGEAVATVVFDMTSASEPSSDKKMTITLDKDENTGKWLVHKYSNPL